MNSWDANHTVTEGLYLRDGDIFEKHVFSSWSTLFAESAGYTEVYVLCHGTYDSTDGYRAHKNLTESPGQALSAFTAYSGTRFVMATCANGYATAGNVRGLDGDLGTCYDTTQLPDMSTQTKATLWE